MSESWRLDLMMDNVDSFAVRLVLIRIKDMESHNIGQTMLYVNNQDEAKEFEKAGFTVLSEEANGVFDFADSEDNYFAVLEKK